MNLVKILKNIFLVLLFSFVLSACATKTKQMGSQLQGDVYTGTDTVEYLAKGVPDRVFFATNESILTPLDIVLLITMAHGLRCALTT